MESSVVSGDESPTLASASRAHGRCPWRCARPEGGVAPRAEEEEGAKRLEADGDGTAGMEGEREWSAVVVGPRM